MIRIFLILRMIIAAIVVGMGIMILQLTRDEFPVRPLYLLLVLSYLTGGLFYASIKAGVKINIALWGIIIIDILTETALIHFSGGMASQFSLIYYLTIIGAALMLQIPGGVGSSVIASFCYILYGVLTGNGYLSPVSIDFQNISSTGILESYMHVSIFILVGAVAGYLGQRIKYKGILLEKAETRLKQLKVDTDYILNHMSSGVLVVDSNSRVITINPAAADILGISREESVSCDIRDIFDGNMPQLLSELEFALKSNQTRLRHEITIRNLKDREIPLGISTSLLKDERGISRGVIAVFQDLTEVREMQERIRRADRLAAIGELSAGIAHEIRNPLASISGSIEMLSHELKLSGENKRLMELIMKESDRLDRIITDFLDFARMRPLQVRSVSIGKLIRDMLTLLRNSQYMRRGICTRYVDSQRDLYVSADEEQMKQVFINLAVNACEAMPKGGDLVVTAERLGDEWVQARFEDQGIGITEEEKGRLFKPFFTTKDGGTGLGLAIANKIVEAHGGRIVFKNREEGGAEFSVILPGAIEKARKSNREPRADEPKQAISSNGR